MPKIFISYRRADSRHVTQMFYLLMRQHFGTENVFLDVDDIPIGVDYRQYLAEQIAGVDVVLVMIGQHWGEIMRDKANEAVDYVRIEVESALKQGKLVVPVLVMDAQMPDFSTLPSSIEGLQWINASKVRELPDLERDCERLAKGIERALNHHGQQNSRNEILTLLDEINAASKQINKTDQSKNSETVSPQKRPPSVKVPPRPDKSILPDPFEWIYIPAGKVTLEAGGYIPEGGKTFHVDNFYIAKYPITNSQYAVYLKETGEEPELWGKADFNQSLQPVVGVSWFDAINYCEWLSQKLDYKVILPTEQQWQRAAQGDDGRTYPWGNERDSRKANTEESKIGKTTPVNQYPDGASPYDVFDMAGNVWEWCLTAWKNGSEDINETNVRRVLRGGSFHLSQLYARSSSRRSFNPNDAYHFFGCRLVVAP